MLIIHFDTPNFDAVEAGLRHDTDYWWFGEDIRCSGRFLEETFFSFSKLQKNKPIIRVL